MPTELLLPVAKFSILLVAGSIGPLACLYFWWTGRRNARTYHKLLGLGSVRSTTSVRPNGGLFTHAPVLVLNRGDAAIVVKFSSRASVNALGVQLYALLPPATGQGRDRVPPPVFSLRREDWIDRLALALKISDKVRVGDPAFDQRVYIESDLVSPEIAELVRDPGLRQAAVRLLDRGVCEIGTASLPHEVTDAQEMGFVAAPLLAIMSLDARDSASAADTLNAAADDLIRFARAFPGHYGAEGPPRAHGEDLLFASLTVFALLAGLHTLLVKLALPMRRIEPHEALLVVSLWAACCAPLLQHLRGRPRSLRYFTLIAGLGLANLALLVAAALRLEALLERA